MVPLSTPYIAGRMTLNENSIVTKLVNRIKGMLSPQPFRLFDLPREVRDKVYANSILAGDLAIRRTCHAANNETLEVLGLLYKRGECAIIVDLNHLSHATIKGRCRSWVPKGELLENIRHLDIDVLLGHNTNYGPPQVMPVFPEVQGLTKLETCRINIKHALRVIVQPPTIVITFFKTLAVFKTVTIKMELGTIFHPRDRRVLAVYNGFTLNDDLVPGPTHMNEVIYHRSQGSLFERLGASLEQALGPATYHDHFDPKFRYLEFHPNSINDNGRDLITHGLSREHRAIRRWNAYPRRMTESEYYDWLNELNGTL